MAIPKQWFTLKELSEKWQCAISDLLHLGITGQLDLSFDWVVLRQETIEVSFEFTEIYDISYCEQAQQERKYTMSIPPPEYEKSPLLRLAHLSLDDVAIINKHGVVPVHKAFLSSFEYFNVYMDDNASQHQYPLISIDDLVVTSDQIKQYNKTQEATHSLPQNKSIREVESDEKLIALLINTVVKKTSGKRLYHGDKLSALQIANLLEENLPEGMSDVGISNETIRKKISKSLKILDPQNN